MREVCSVPSWVSGKWRTAGAHCTWLEKIAHKIISLLDESVKMYYSFGPRIFFLNLKDWQWAEIKQNNFKTR